MPSSNIARPKKPKVKPWHVYLVRCSDGSIYTGISDNVEARIQKHNTGRGAKYTAQRRPVSLLYSEKLADQGSAMRREAQIKKWKRAQKLALAQS
jgi:predicted GIY-YIG superfamily endonuclease